MHLRSTLFFAVALLAAGTYAEDTRVKNLRIEHPYARATVPQQTTGAAYLSIENEGKSADRLIGAQSPAAKSVEFHTMSTEGNLMKMREVPAIELKPGAKLEMTPGGDYHVMLQGLRQPLKAGDKFPLILNFEKAGKAELTVVVEDAKKSEKAGAHHH